MSGSATDGSGAWVSGVLKAAADGTIVPPISGTRPTRTSTGARGRCRWNTSRERRPGRADKRGVLDKGKGPDALQREGGWGQIHRGTPFRSGALDSSRAELERPGVLTRQNPVNSPTTDVCPCRIVRTSPRSRATAQAQLQGQG